MLAFPVLYAPVYFAIVPYVLEQIREYCRTVAADKPGPTDVSSTQITDYVVYVSNDAFLQRNI